MQSCGEEEKRNNRTIFLRSYGNSQTIKNTESVEAIIFYALKTDGIKISIKLFSGILIDGKERIVIILISHFLDCLCVS